MMVNAKCFGAVIKKRVLASALALLCSAPTMANAQGLALESITYSALPGDQVQIRLGMSGPAITPGAFTVDNPARLALDFPNTSSRLPKRNVEIGVGAARSATAVEAGGRTRVVLNLTRVVGYQTKVEGSDVYVTLGAPTAQAGSAAGATVVAGQYLQAANVREVDFRRGEDGAGRVVLRLANPNIPIDLQQQGDRILISLHNSSLPEELERRLDVMDFGTPVRTVDAYGEGKDVRVVISAAGKYEHIAYQADDYFTVDVKPVVEPRADQAAAKKPQYNGERLSLNFQTIDVRAVLQLIADFTGTNMVTSDSVQGTLTLRLKNVPWDQALDIILKSKGLGMRQEGNVIMVAPAEEIAAREKLELEAAKQIQELAPLRNESIQINYAKAAELAGLLRGEGNSLLSDRGKVSIDQRTNRLLVQDTEDNLAQIRALVAELDIPIRQVLIESRIVIARDDFSKEIGARFGVSGARENGNNGVIVGSGTIRGTDSMVTQGQQNIINTGDPFPINVPNVNDRLNVNLPVIGSAGQIALAVLGSDYLVDLELSALQLEGEGKIISSPRVITSNQQEARIEQGVEIPYQEASSSGATSVSFKKAVLSLSVVPQITPDDRVIMDLQVNKDSVGQVFAGIPSIDTREVRTQVLVNNGETVVLGGIYEQTKTHEVTRVPFFGDLPIVGILFRQTRDLDEKAELLIFVTPKILKETFAAQF